MTAPTDSSAAAPSHIVGPVAIAPASLALPTAAARSARRLAGRDETVLGVLPGVCPSSRTAVVLSRSLCGHASLRLQTESFSDDMGWYAQGSVELTAEQLADLRPLLGLAAGQMDTPAADEPPATLPLRA